jgi:hypothetical protein
VTSDQGKTYSAFIEAELKAERDRRASLDARGLAVVTTSASLVTLLAAVGAFASTAANFRLPGTAVPWLIVTLVGFVVATILGILANANGRYKVTDRPALDRMRTEHWTDQTAQAMVNVAYINTVTSDTLRRGNNIKVGLATSALSAQLIALIALAVTVFIILDATPH